MGSKAIPNITIDLEALNQQEHLFYQYSIFVKKNVYSILAGRHSSKLRGRGLDFEESRKYVAGDDIRNIDWNVTARTRTPYTKVFNEEKERPSFALVDQSSSMFFGSERYMKSYVAAILAAIAGFKVLKAGDRFGGIVFNDSESSHIPAKRSRKNLQHFFNHMVHYNQQLQNQNETNPSKNSLNESLFKVSSSITHDYVVVVISDFLKANDETYRHLLNLTKHNDVICMMVRDRLEMSLPDQKILLSDGEKQMLWNNGKEKSASFSDKMIENAKTFESNMLKYGIPTLSFNTHEDIADQMKRVIQNTLKR